ncbi:methyltransferase family protein [Lacipirellula parvula]|uniref:NnrU domain-containing protein n=1 Tax=Lacipirellula parvula TaxID=2650471 RepID=A0A5K7XGL1_9BACT|nr:NnrU family protein [Lacipirellula parvula]BBO33426.1 hypothetical protein PLANPX_3038 [Lacipirellula parvula]
MDGTCSDAVAVWRRAAGLIVGVTAQAMFAVTVVWLYQFLSDTAGAPVTQSAFPTMLLGDVGLALLFAAPHSLLRFPKVQSMICRTIGREFFGVFYCIVTCVSLWIVFYGWQGSERVVWELHGWPRSVVVVAFNLSWLALGYSLLLTGLGYQTGFTEWSHWARRLPLPRRRFEPAGAYRRLRHPVYLSFAGLIWFTPQMTLDHALLTAVWTVYLAIGSYLKDERLAHYMGEEYRQYQQKVPGYPLVPFGPLSKRRGERSISTGG